MALIRYPGSKEKLALSIMEYFPPEFTYDMWKCTSRDSFVEPFFGAGAMGFKVMSNMPPSRPVWINDIDTGMCALWQAILSDPIELCRKIERFKPSAEAFYQFKHMDGNGEGGVIEQGFRKLVLHRLSFSGLGFKSGGPLGGKKQENAKYPVNCRWADSRMKKDIIQIHKKMRVFSDLKITCLHFRDVLRQVESCAFVYLDPPYYKKGAQLYKHDMTPDEHAELAEILKCGRFRWVLSYDDCDEIRALYSWATFKPIFAKYCVGHNQIEGVRPKNNEVLIIPPASECAAVA